MRRETHLGKVLGNVDPTKSGGAKIQAADLVDGPLDSEDVFPGRFPIAGDDEGFYFAPPKGGLVEVEAVADDAEGVEDLGAVWVGMRYSDKDKIPSEFRSDAVARGGIKWGDGVLLFDKAADLVAFVSENVRLGEETASEEVVRGTKFNSEFNTFLADLTTFVTALGTIPAHSPATSAFIPKIAAFQAKFSTWLSTKVKTE